MTQAEIVSLRETFHQWRKETSPKPDAERIFEERFLELKRELEDMGFGVEVHQDYLTGRHFTESNPSRRTECYVFKGALEFKTSEISHSANAKVCALHEAFMRVLTWLTSQYEYPAAS